MQGTGVRKRVCIEGRDMTLGLPCRAHFVGMVSSLKSGLCWGVIPATEIGNSAALCTYPHVRGKRGMRTESAGRECVGLGG